MSTDVGYPDNDDGRSNETGRVSLLSVHQMLSRIQLDIQTLRQDVHYMRESQMNREQANERRFNDQENRIRTLEANRIDPSRIHTIESKRYLEARSVTTVFAILLPICAIIVAIIAIIVK